MYRGIMRLYKYMSLDSLEAILKHRSIGFSRAVDLNDPFDWPTGPDVPDYGLFGGITATMKGHIWVDSMGICSLIRSATNSLMWAHYGDKHRGAVLEIDAHVAGLTALDCNAVPAHFGSVIFMNQPNMSPYGSITNPAPVRVGELFEFRADYYQQLQRLFLSKPLCWAYEEEVRVVKCLRGLGTDHGENASGTFSIIARPDGSPMFAYHLPPGSIVGVYFGIKARRANVSRLINDFELSNAHVAHQRRGSYDVHFQPVDAPKAVRQRS